MADTIIKPNKDEDFYVLWSSIVDSPLAWGSAEELAGFHEEIRGEPPTPERMARVDRTGTSALWPSAEDPYMAWGDPDQSLIFEQRGTIRRDRLKALCERLGTERSVTDLLDPFDGEDEPRV